MAVTAAPLLVRVGDALKGIGLVDRPISSTTDWSDTNVPWAYKSTEEFTAEWPVQNLQIVDIQTGSADFYTNLMATVNAAPGRVIVRLGAGTYRFNQFRMIGSSGDPTYSFGFWHTKLQGFLGQGADKTVIQMDANSMSQAQLDKLATMNPTLFAPNMMSLLRIDSPSAYAGTAGFKIYIAGVTFQAADQQNLTSVDWAGGGVAPYTPQPAPHGGLVIYNQSEALVTHTRFVGAGRAMSSAPPFEHANVSSQRSIINWKKCEFDGRRAASLDPARPRRCGPVMANNETVSEFEDCWMHHSNVSRYAANDENSATSGHYSFERCKLEQITNNLNSDPAINGGNTLNGYTNATVAGWESCSGTIDIRNSIISQDNPNKTNPGGAGQFACHVQFTSTGGRNPQGGRINLQGNQYRCTVWPSVDGFLSIRVASATHWWQDGIDNTVSAQGSTGRLAPYVVSATWPPSAQDLATAGVTPTTHYLVRTV